LAFVAQGDNAPDGKIWDVNLATKISSLVATNLDRPGGIVALDDDHLAVATANAVIKIRTQLAVTAAQPQLPSESKHLGK
jgi:hypothetical protein